MGQDRLQGPQGHSGQRAWGSRGDRRLELGRQGCRTLRVTAGFWGNTSAENCMEDSDRLHT